MSDTSKSLRKAADEIENEGHLGWGNTCRWAADEFDALSSRLADVSGERDLILIRAENAETALGQVEARLAEAERDSQRLDWLERHLFEGRWDGTIGRPKSWYMAGPYRHTLQRMRGDALREAIDLAMRADSATDDTALEPGEEWWMDVAGVPVKLDEWEPGAKKRKADQPPARDE